MGQTKRWAMQLEQEREERMAALPDEVAELIERVAALEARVLDLPSAANILYAHVYGKGRRGIADGYAQDLFATIGAEASIAAILGSDEDIGKYGLSEQVVEAAQIWRRAQVRDAYSQACRLWSEHQEAQAAESEEVVTDASE